MTNRFQLRTAAFLLFAGTTMLQAQEVKFHKGSWADALTMAAAEKKMIMVDAYTDWCGWCKVMDKKTFTDPAVAEMLNTSFFPVKKEMEKETDGQKLAMKYHVSSFPTFLFFDSEGKLLYISHGYEPAEAFIKTLEKVREMNAHPSEAGARQNDAVNGSGLNPGFPEFYINDFKEKRPKVDEKTISLFFDSQTDKASEVCWGVLWRFSHTNVCADIILQNYQSLKTRYGVAEVEEVTQRVISKKASAAIKADSKTEYDAALALIDKYMSNAAEKEAFRMGLNLNYFEAKKDWAGYAGVVQPVFDKKGIEEAGMLNQTAWTIYEKCDDKAVLKQATVWMKAVAENLPEYMYLDTYAALLYKTAAYKEAEKFANLAIDAGERSGEDVSATKSLLELIKLKVR